jgi:hypothetical protein
MNLGKLKHVEKEFQATSLHVPDIVYAFFFFLIDHADITMSELIFLQME